jgi:photosystem II stability/assembly factor-like uncharacterized protein
MLTSPDRIPRATLVPAPSFGVPHRSAAHGLAAALLALCASFATESARAGAWEPVGPWGGPVQAVAISPHDPDHLLAATRNGVFVSHDGGERWAIATSGLTPDAMAARDVAFSPIDPEVAWMGGSGGIWRSVDGGRSWGHPSGTGGPSGGCQRLAVAPDGRVYGLFLGGMPGHPEPGQLWASDDGTQWAKLRTRVATFAIGPDGVLWAASSVSPRLYRSADRGSSWQRANAVTLPFQRPTALTVDPDQPNRLWAAAARRLWRSDDGGRRFTLLRNDLLGFAQVLAATPGPQRRLFVGTTRGLLASTDGGTTISLFGSRLRNQAVIDVAWDPSASSPELWAAVDSFGLPTAQTQLYGLWKAASGPDFAPAMVGLHALPATAWASASPTDTAFVGAGTLWSGQPGTLAPVRQARFPAEAIADPSGLAFDAGAPDVLLAADSGRLLRSTDGGRNFEAKNRGFLQAVTWCSATPDGTLFAGGGGPLLRSTDRGVSFAPSEPFAPGETNGLFAPAIDPADPQHLVVLGTHTNQTVITWKAAASRDGGVTWEPRTLPDAGIPEEPLSRSGQRLAFAADGALLFAGTQGLWRHTPGGWDLLAPGLVAVDLLTAGARTWALAPHDPTTPPQLWQTEDGGATWTRCDQGLEQLPRATRLLAAEGPDGLVVLGTAGAWQRTAEACAAGPESAGLAP